MDDVRSRPAREDRPPAIERVMFSPIPAWVLLLVLLAVAPAAIGIGFLARDPMRYGVVGRVAEAVTLTPWIIGDLIKGPKPYAVEQDPPSSAAALPGGFTLGASQPLVDPGYALITAFDEARGRPVVQLIRLSDGAVRHVYAPDVRTINARSSFRSALIDLRRDKNAPRFLPMHPALLPDGGLLVHDTGPLTKIDACGRVVWEIDGIFHHSVEPDADGLFWAAYSPPRSQEPGVGPRFSDDSVVAMSRRSPFANALALALWLPPFEAGRTPMKRFALLAAAMAFALPAAAQNAAQVSRAVAGTSCPGCNLFQADFGNKEMTGKSFAGARMRQSDMSAAVMNRTSFARADMRDVNAYGAVFTGANFSGADLTNASFVGTYLEGANLSGAKLSGTNFSGAEMDRAIGLHQAQLSAACGDESTKLPRGLSLRPCS